MHTLTWIQEHKGTRGSKTAVIMVKVFDFDNIPIEHSSGTGSSSYSRSAASRAVQEAWRKLETLTKTVMSWGKLINLLQKRIKKSFEHLYLVLGLQNNAWLHDAMVPCPILCILLLLASFLMVSNTKHGT